MSSWPIRKAFFPSVSVSSVQGQASYDNCSPWNNQFQLRQLQVNNGQDQQVLELHNLQKDRKRRKYYSFPLHIKTLKLKEKSFNIDGMEFDGAGNFHYDSAETIREGWKSLMEMVFSGRGNFLKIRKLVVHPRFENPCESLKLNVQNLVLVPWMDFRAVRDFISEKSLPLESVEAYLSCYKRLQEPVFGQSTYEEEPKKRPLLGNLDIGSRRSSQPAINFGSWRSERGSNATSGTGCRGSPWTRTGYTPNEESESPGSNERSEPG
ncbi:unnamed protein product [Caenorhabditis nigoni]